MKKIQAFFTALVLFIIVVLCIHVRVSKNLNAHCRGYGTWINAYKDLSCRAIQENMSDDTVLFMGSSEFQHERNKNYHPTKVFRKADQDVMCIGAAYNQSLSHAITLAAVAPKLKSRKVILILSPSWFEKGGVSDHAFPVRFSESAYVAMMENPDLSKGLKKAIARRTVPLLKEAPTMQDSVEKYNTYFLNRKNSHLTDRMYLAFRRAIVNEKEAININTLWRLKGKKEYDKIKPKITGEKPDFAALRGEKGEGAELNPYHMAQAAYRRKYRTLEKTKKNAQTRKRYPENSPEYGDLELFLRVCREEHIDVELMLIPVNGYWYDYTGFQEKYRNVLPGQIRQVTDKYHVKLHSFFDKAYEDGWFEDVYHPAGKGWCAINEEAYRFFTETGN